jgi:hypothetical protein
MSGTLGVARIHAGVGLRCLFFAALRGEFVELLALGDCIVLLVTRPSGSARTSGIRHGGSPSSCTDARNAASHVPLRASRAALENSATLAADAARHAARLSAPAA